MRLTALALAALFIPDSAYALDRYEFDKEHTTILFCVSHLGFSEMLGVFTSYDGSFEFDPASPQDSKVDVTLRPRGIRTSSAALDKELQGEHFFNTAAFPEIRFASTGVRVTGDHTGDLTGNVTLLGVTRPVTLHVRFNRADYHPLTQDYIAGFSAEATLKRSDFGMDYLTDMVGDEVKLEIEAEGIDLDRKQAQRVKR